MRVSYAGCASPVAPETITARVSAPWLAGETVDELFIDSSAAGENHGLDVYHADGLLIGSGRATMAAGELVQATHELYRRVLAATRGLHLYRVWNYVPRINEVAGPLENYRAFCQGRSLAFEENFGPDFARELCAASAVGCDGDALELVFAAGRIRGRHVENPEQVPAYCYPPEHGPRSPSFARATVGAGDTRHFMFVSGTSAIKGHATIAPGDLDGQLDCTLDNLRLVSREMRVGETLGADFGSERHFKVYLRHAADLPAVRARLACDLFLPSDKVTYLRADICRAALNIEIEATLVRTLD